MKQLLFLLFFPCLTWAQYPSNGNQKITLGEQTTADGLVWRGLRADTTSKIVPFSDTSAYIILDTVEKTLWLYKAGQVPKWQQVGGSTLDTATMLLPYWRSGRFSGVLPVANGGTNLTTFTAANRIPYASSATALTTTNKFTFDSNGNKLIIGKNDSLDSNPNYTINLSGSDTPAPVLGFRLYNTTLNKVSIFRYDNNHSFVFANNDADNGLGAHRFRIGSGSGEEILTITRPTPSGTDGRVGIGTASPSEKLHVVGNGLFTGSVTANSLSLTTPLPVANGGTNASTFAVGSVVFAGSGGTYTEDNSNLFFDNTNNRLGIGLTNPEAKLHIKSDVNGPSNMIFENLQGGPNSSASIYLKTRNVAGNADVTGIITKTKTGGYYFDNNENSTNAFMQFSNYLTTWMYADGYGKVGIGTVSPTARLQVKGSANAAEFALRVEDSGNNNLLSVQNNGDVTLKNPLSVANGGTGSATQNFVDLTTAQSIGGIKTLSNELILNNSLARQININSNNQYGGYILFQKNSSNIGFLGNAAQLLTGSTTEFEFRAQTTLNLTAPTDIKLYSRDVLALTLGASQAATFSGSVTANSLSLTTPLSVANGGTNTSTAFTAGSVVFAGASGTYTQDNSGLFFDNTNNRLGINTASPLGLLEARSTVGGTQNGLFSLYENSATSPYYTFRKARGTPASPSAVQLNDGMGDLSFQGYHPDGFLNAVVLRAFNYLAPGASYLNGGFKILINSQANGGLVEYLNIISNGNTGIGDNLVPTERLHVGGNVRITAMNGINDIGASATGVLQAATSDMNLKNTIEDSPFGLNEILLLKPVTFLYNDENRKIDSDVKEVGFIAQDVFDIIPNAVSSTGTGDLQLDYRAITATLVKAIQEQNALIKALEQRILILENK